MKFKGNVKKLNWALNLQKEGKRNFNVPDLSGWDLRLIEFYSICSTENGISVSDLRIVFDSLGIQSKVTFYETLLVLTRVSHYLKGNQNANN